MRFCGKRMSYTSTPNKKLNITQKPSKKALVKVLTKPVKQAVKKVEQEERKDFGSRLNRNFARPGLGQALGNVVMPGVGGILGHAAESLFRTIIGQGEYKYSDNLSPEQMPYNNTIVGQQTALVKQSVDQVHWSGLATRIAHREYLGSVGMTNSFQAYLKAIDVTDVGTFPWLAPIATNFQKWKILGMVFEYVPTSANAIAAGTPAMGAVALSFQSDVNLPQPNTMVNILNTQGSVSGRPTDSLICAVECDGAYTPVNPLYVRHPSLTTYTNLVAFGNLVIATEGPAIYSNAGQLWVTYDIQLISAFVESPSPKQEEKKCTLPHQCTCGATVAIHADV